MRLFYHSRRLILVLAVFLSAKATGFSQSSELGEYMRLPLAPDKMVYFKWIGQLQRIEPDGRIAVSRGPGKWAPRPDFAKHVVLGDQHFWAFANRLFLQAADLKSAGKRSTYFLRDGKYYQIKADGHILAWRPQQRRWEPLANEARRRVIGRQEYWSVAGRQYVNRSKTYLLPSTRTYWRPDGPPLFIRTSGATTQRAGSLPQHNRSN